MFVNGKSILVMGRKSIATDSSGDTLKDTVDTIYAMGEGKPGQSSHPIKCVISIEHADGNTLAHQTVARWPIDEE